MGCRTRVMGNIYDPDKEISFGRGNLSFTSINLPRLAIRSRGDVNEFFDKLDQMLDLCIDQLLERFEIQCRRKVMNYPFLMGQKVWLDSDKLKPEDEVREVLKHGTLTVGFIGLAETLKALIGHHHGESEKAQILGLQIVAHMRRRVDEACQKYHLNFSLIATPDFIEPSNLSMNADTGKSYPSKLLITETNWSKCSSPVVALVLLTVKSDHVGSTVTSSIASFPASIAL